MSKAIVRIISILILLFILFLVFHGCSSEKKLDYYSCQDNYLTATGTLIHAKYSDDGTFLCLAFSDLNPGFDDNNFKLVGDNLTICQRNGIDEVLIIGENFEFIVAPRYWGDGYIMPIVGITINGKCYLTFEEGYTNLLKWLA